MMNICIPHLVIESIMDKLNTKYWYSTMQNKDEESYEEALKKADDFEYRPYDCSMQALGGAVQVSRKKLNIVEGSYCLHPELEHAYDLKVLLTVNPDVRRDRILQRPEFLHKRFFEEWIPMEQMYFNSSRITERCDMILTNINL